MYTYPIDYEQFTQEEIVKIIEFLALIEELNEGKKFDPHVVSRKHKEYRTIINSIAMEKTIDRDFQKVSGYSIHKTIKKLQ